MRNIRFKPRLRQTVEQNMRSLQLLGATPEDIAGHKASIEPYLPKTRGPRKPRIGPSEHQVQASVIQWWALAHKGYNLPLFSLFAIPNGGARDPITGSLLKAEGVRKGTPDLMLAAPQGATCGLFLEMKVGDNTATAEQQQMVDYLNRAGYKASVHWTSESAIVAIQQYLA